MTASPDVLHDRARLVEDGGVHLPPMGVELAGQHGGIGGLGDGAVAPHVGHEHGDLQPLGAAQGVADRRGASRPDPRQQPAQRLALLLTIHDGAVQQPQAPQRPLAARRHPLGQLHEQRLDGGVDGFGGGVP